MQDSIGPGLSGTSELVVGRGRHERVIIDLQRFRQRLAARESSGQR